MGKDTVITRKDGEEDKRIDFDKVSEQDLKAMNENPSTEETAEQSDASGPVLESDAGDGYKWMETDVHTGSKKLGTWRKVGVAKVRAAKELKTFKRDCTKADMDDCHRQQLTDEANGIRTLATKKPTIAAKARKIEKAASKQLSPEQKKVFDARVIEEMDKLQEKVLREMNA